MDLMKTFPDIWLDYAKRMDFRGKDDSPLVSWTDAEGAFEHWRNSTDGRPCDYSGISYELLSRGSGIQWVRLYKSPSLDTLANGNVVIQPCNKGAPNGTERLYTDGVFPTMEHHTQVYS
jgi:ferredoxin-nitrate reductase